MAIPLSQKLSELLDDMAFENERPAEKWFSREDFDPAHGKSELNHAAQRGLIEIERCDTDNWRFRFTAKGRDFHEANQSKDAA